MKVMVNFGIILFLLATTLAGIGAYKAKKRTLNYKTGPRHAKLAATLVVALAFWMTQSTRALSGIDPWNLAFFLVLLWTVVYYMVWGTVVFVLNLSSHKHEHAHSSMLSMLYIDHAHEAMLESADPERAHGDPASAAKASDKKSWSD